MRNIEINKFLEKTREQDLFSLVVRQNGDVIKEYHKGEEVLRPIYSATKSFTSTAVGMAVDEGLLSVDDYVLSFFEDEELEGSSEKLKALKVKDLLVMAMGHMSGYLMGDNVWATPTRHELEEKNWIKYCMERPMPYNPGEKFIYDNSCGYLLAVIVQKVSGMTLCEYLKPRLFEPLGIEEYEWEVCPRGYNFGAGGMFLKASDLSKLGELYLNKGRWNDVQLISKEWVEEATSKHIDTPKRGDWGKGYGYQFWMGENNSYRADGKLGQFCIVLPKKNAVVTTMAKADNVKEIMNAIWDEIYPQL